MCVSSDRSWPLKSNRRNQRKTRNLLGRTNGSTRAGIGRSARSARQRLLPATLSETLNLIPAVGTVRRVERCCHFLESADAVLSDDACEFGPFDPLEPQGDDESSPTCPSCGQPMIPQGEISKPSWQDVMASADRPWCYAPLHRSAETVASGHSPPLQSLA